MAKLNSTIVTGNLTVTDDINVNGSIKQNGASLSTVAFSGSYNDLSNKPTIPSVSNATITIKQTGISDQSFTLNGSAATISLADNNTWRPLGTGANDACAGNDSRLSDARPASDVYSWAKASTKPSYNFSEIGTGNITMGDGNTYFKYRTYGNLEAGFYYQTAANESVVFANEYSHAGWMFVNGVKPSTMTDWRTLSPTFQIKDGAVSVNKLLANDTTPTYNLDVNGSANATTLYENGNRVITSANIGSQSVSYATSAGSAGSASTATIAEGLSSNSMSVTTAVTSNTSNMTVGSGVTKFKIWNDGRMLIDATMQPWSTQSDINLGTSVNRWNNIYLKGNLSDGSNSIAVANIGTVKGISVGPGLSVTSASTVPEIQIAGGYKLPTTSEWNAISGGSAPSNMVTTDTDQTVTGTKTFRNGIIIGDSNASSCNIQMYDAANGDLSVDGIILNDDHYNFFDYNSNYVYFSAVYECLGFYSDAYGGEFEYSFPHKSGTFAMTSDCGAKLYKHVVQLTLSDGSTPLYVHIISTQSTPITSYSGGPPRANIAFSSIISVNLSSASYMLFCESYSSSETIFTLRFLKSTYINGGAYYLQQSSSFTFVRDTVTEL